MSISIEHIIENCKTIQDVLDLEKESVEEWMKKKNSYYFVRSVNQNMTFQI